MLPDMETGGAEQGTLELADYLVCNGHYSLVISRGGRMVKDLRKGGSIHVNMPYIGEKSPRGLGHIKNLRRLFSKVDVVHIRSRIPAWIGYLAWKSLPEKKRPLLVTTIHSVYSVSPYTAVMTFGEAVIVVSESVRNYVMSNYRVDSLRLHCIPRGADSRRFNPDKLDWDEVEKNRRKWTDDKNIPVILVPGRFSRVKGQNLVLEAMKFVKGDWRLVFVGDPMENPSYARELEKEAALYPDKVFFTGYRKDIPSLLAASDIMISPSRTPEAFGRTTAEAGMMGKCVLASAHGGSLEIIQNGKTGLLFKPGSPEDMADKLSFLMANPRARETMGTAARMRMTEKFTIESMCRKTLDLYIDMLRQKSETGR